MLLSVANNDQGTLGTFPLFVLGSVGSPPAISPITLDRVQCGLYAELDEDVGQPVLVTVVKLDDPDGGCR